MKSKWFDANGLITILISTFLLAGCHTFYVVQKPIPFNQERRELSIEYLKSRHGIEQTEPYIKPRMVVVHFTVIPTMEKTYAAFEPSVLPGSRKGIQAASSLNVSSQYLIDRDGSIYQLLPDTIFARHVIGLNYCAIGIENVGNGKDLPLTKKQVKANTWLIKELMKKHRLEYMIGHHEYQDFIGHPIWKETDPDYLTKKSDPGDHFMQELRKNLRSLELKGPPYNYK